MAISPVAGKATTSATVKAGLSAPKALERQSDYLTKRSPPISHGVEVDALHEAPGKTRICPVHSMIPGILHHENPRCRRNDAGQHAGIPGRSIPFTPANQSRILPPFAAQGHGFRSSLRRPICRFADPSGPITSRGDKYRNVVLIHLPPMAAPIRASAAMI